MTTFTMDGLPPFNSKFEEGSTDSISQTTSIRIVPKRHWNNQWWWWCLRHNRLNGITPHLLFDKSGRYDAPVANERLAVWATAMDTDTWYEFDHTTIGAVDVEVYNDSAFPGGIIYIASGPMYPFSRIKRVVSAWAAADARIVDTVSTYEFIIGYATERSNGDSRTAPALPFYGLKVTNTSGYTKNNMVLVAYNHPSETESGFMLEGAVDWLLGGSIEAEFLLNYFNVLVYPCLNPQGLYGGWFRSCPENATLDHNRQWATTGVLECIDALKAAWTADSGGSIQVGLDFHGSTGISTVYANAQDDTEAVHVAFENEMVALEPTFIMNTSTTAGILKKHWLDDLSAALSLTLESGEKNTNTITVMKGYGEKAVKSVAAMLSKGRFTNNAGVGARDGNGATDRIDWANIYNPAGQSLTVSLWVSVDALAHITYVINLADAASFGIGCYIYTDGSVAIVRNGTAYGSGRTAAALIPATGVWKHILFTMDTGMVRTGWVMYISGALADWASGTDGNTETAHTGVWSILGRHYDDTRNLDGREAQVGVWNMGSPSAAMIAGLAAGHAPSLYPTNLQFYWKGNTVSLTDTITSTVGVADGTTQVTGVGNGPGIFY